MAAALASVLVHQQLFTDASVLMLTRVRRARGQGAGIFRNGMNGDVTNIFFENNEAALNGGGLYMVGAPTPVCLLVRPPRVQLPCDKGWGLIGIAILLRFEHASTPTSH